MRVVALNRSYFTVPVYTFVHSCKTFVVCEKHTLLLLVPCVALQAEQVGQLRHPLLDGRDQTNQLLDREQVHPVLQVDCDMPEDSFVHLAWPF